MYIKGFIFFNPIDNWKKRKTVPGSARLSRNIKDCNIWRWQGISVHQPDLLVSTTSLQIYFISHVSPICASFSPFLCFHVIRLWNSRWICVVTDALIRLWYVDKCIEMHKNHMCVYTRVLLCIWTRMIANLVLSCEQNCLRG